MNKMARAAGVSLALFLLVAPPGFAQGVVRGGALPPPLPLFPPDNWWNVNVSAAPLDVNSANLINFIGPGTPLHPDLGGDSSPAPSIYGMVYAVVPGTQPLVPVTFVEYGGESDAGAPGRPPGYPIPVEAQTQSKWIEGGQVGGGTSGDRHMLLVDRDNRILYELYHAHWNAALSRWEAGSGAIYSLDSNARRPEGWTSADAAGLAILPGLIRYDEVFGPDPIRHAFRFTVDSTNGHVFPASHTAGSTSGAPPMGARLRLKASVNLSGYPPEVQKIFQAMKTYGLIVADNGTSMYIGGTYDTRWDNGVLNPAFSSLHASDFEVVGLGWKPPIGTGSPNLAFYTLVPCRLLDTRRSPGAYGAPAVPPGLPRVVVASGQCGVPPTAKAVSVNVTVVGAPQSGDLRLFPGNAAGSSASALNFSAGQTRANNLILMLASSGTGTFAIQNDAATASVHVVVDVGGYFQ
ncbi:MAG TPA: hypothetical protein VMR54_11540 [Thermoanaerobaculia bacterium]|nr:hypothetical protein [Thermoanaerobaculia bacterium]